MTQAADLDRSIEIGTTPDEAWASKKTGASTNFGILGQFDLGPNTLGQFDFGANRMTILGIISSYQNVKKTIIEGMSANKWMPFAG